MDLTSGREREIMREEGEKERQKGEGQGNRIELAI